jgi:hypothetical protein
MGKSIRERAKLYEKASKMKTDWLREEILMALLAEETNLGLRQKILSYLGDAKATEDQKKTREANCGRN